MIKLRIIFLIFLILLLLPIFRYYELSKDRDLFVSKGTNQSTVTEINFLPRGKIVDRNDNQLALDIVRQTLLFSNETQKETVFKLAKAEGIPIFLNSNRRLWFENEIDVDFLKKAKLACNCSLIQEPRSRRYYPYGSIASTVIGFSGTDGGLEGVEKVFENEISKSESSQSFLRNRRGEKIFGDLTSFNLSNDQKSLKLTLDITLQYKLFDELKNAISANDAKGLLKSAIRDPNPVIFLENEILYNDKSASSEIRDELIPIGKANILIEGTDVSIISYGIGIKHSLMAIELAKDINISVELIDLRSLRPIDYNTVFESIKKTNRCITVEECFPVCSIGNHLSASIMENVFDYLDSPVINCTGKDVPMPYAKNLELAALITPEEIFEKIKKVTYLD